MIIEAKIFSHLRHYIPNSYRHLDENKWDILEGATVAQVLEMPNPPEMEAKTLLVNCRNADSDGVLNEGDVLHVFPPMSGG